MYNTSLIEICSSKFVCNTPINVLFQSFLGTYPLEYINSLVLTTGSLMGSWADKELPARLFFIPPPLYTA